MRASGSDLRPPAELASGEECLEDYSLLDLVRGRKLERGGRDGAEASAHVALCSHCRARRDHFAALEQAVVGAAPVRAPRSRRWVVMLLALLVTVVTIGLLVF